MNIEILHGAEEIIDVCPIHTEFGDALVLFDANKQMSILWLQRGYNRLQQLPFTNCSAYSKSVVSTPTHLIVAGGEVLVAWSYRETNLSYISVLRSGKHSSFRYLFCTLSPDNKSLLVSADNNMTYLFDIEHLASTIKQLKPIKQFKTACATPGLFLNNDLFVIFYVFNVLQLYSIESGFIAQLAYLETSDNHQRPLLAKKDEIIYLAYNHKIYRIHKDQENALIVTEYFTHKEPICCIDISPRDDQLALVDQKGGAVLLDLQRECANVIKQIPRDRSGIRGIFFGRRQGELYTLVNNTIVRPSGFKPHFPNGHVYAITYDAIAFILSEGSSRATGIAKPKVRWLVRRYSPTKKRRDNAECGAILLGRVCGNELLCFYVFIAGNSKQVQVCRKSIQGRKIVNNLQQMHDVFCNGHSSYVGEEITNEVAFRLLNSAQEVPIPQPRSSRLPGIFARLSKQVSEQHSWPELVWEEATKQDLSDTSCYENDSEASPSSR